MQRFRMCIFLWLVLSFTLSYPSVHAWLICIRVWYRYDGNGKLDSFFRRWNLYGGLSMNL